MAVLIRKIHPAAFSFMRLFLIVFWNTMRRGRNYMILIYYGEIIWIILEAYSKRQLSEMNLFVKIYVNIDIIFKSEIIPRYTDNSYVDFL